MAAAKKRFISTGRARLLAAQASVDPRTLDKLLRGEEVSGLAGERARKILIENGLLIDDEPMRATG